MHYVSKILEVIVISQKGECSNTKTQYKNYRKVNNKSIYTSESTKIAKSFYYIGGEKRKYNSAQNMRHSRHKSSL